MLHGHGPVPHPLPNPITHVDAILNYIPCSLFQHDNAPATPQTWLKNHLRSLRHFQIPQIPISHLWSSKLQSRENPASTMDLRRMSSIWWRSPGANLEPSAESWEPQEKTLMSPIKGLWCWLWRGPRLYQIKILGPRRQTDGQTTSTLHLKLMGRILKIGCLHLMRYWLGTNKTPSYNDQNDTYSHGIKRQLCKIGC